MKEFLALVILLQAITGFGQQETELVGQVYNIDRDTLILAQSHKDLRYSGIEIPVQSGETFKYVSVSPYLRFTAFVLTNEMRLLTAK